MAATITRTLGANKIEQIAVAQTGTTATATAISTASLRFDDGWFLYGFIVKAGTTTLTSTADLTLVHDSSGADVLSATGANLGTGGVKFGSDFKGPVPLLGTYTLTWANNSVSAPSAITTYLFVSRNV